jgi:hypothetical protein
MHVPAQQSRIYERLAAALERAELRLAGFTEGGLTDGVVHGGGGCLGMRG